LRSVVNSQKKLWPIRQLVEFVTDSSGSSSQERKKDKLTLPKQTGQQRVPALNAVFKLNGFFACIADNDGASQFVVPALFALVYAHPNKPKA